MLDDEDTYGEDAAFQFDVLPTHLPARDAMTMFYQPERLDDAQIRSNTAPEKAAMGGYIGRAGKALKGISAALTPHSKRPPADEVQGDIYLANLAQQLRP